ncbi:Plant peroxidase [Macleaya cordata]|uniref:peroxidase n=1 Tax=Macleaya cordata TaxID=56857 RepID=A0A200PLW4_MACCD|nr:Plant peroxidase [Macleaya cordata]
MKKINNFWIALVFGLGLISVNFRICYSALEVGFYDGKCGNQDVESIINGVVTERFTKDPSIVAALLRMQFHDCFVTGCDASLLLNGSSSEKEAGPNQSVRGYDLIDDAKAAVEQACSGVVSCADIIIMATRDAVALSGGTNARYEVETGRKDGLVSLANNVDLPGPTISVSAAINVFNSKGLTTTDMVLLLGGHTVGITHCSFIFARLYNFENTGMSDPSMDPDLVTSLKSLCPRDSNTDNEVDLDQNPSSSNIVDNSFYEEIRSSRGILQIDQELALDPSTSAMVDSLADGSTFLAQFGAAMVKLGAIDVLTAIINGVVTERFTKDPSIVAALLRMQFHDCFVTGCDASLLLDGSSSEKKAGPNLSVRGYDLINDAKAAVEEACSEVVSCADIIIMATRDAVALSGGTDARYEVETGRKDGLVSLQNNVDLPGPSISVSDAIDVFNRKGLTTTDMVLLLGGHTVGITHCSFIRNRLYNFKNTGMADPSMDPDLVTTLKSLCPKDLNTGNTIDLDQNPSSSKIVDNSFYEEIRSSRGILQIDQELALDPSTSAMVDSLADGSTFLARFGAAMVKLVSLLTLGVLGLILVSFITCSYANNQLQVGFYKGKCGQKDVEATINDIVAERFNTDPSIVAALLRMQFHDCFVTGCDASLLLDGSSTEKNAGPNLSVRGYDLINDAKLAVEKDCPETISCADIIAIATRDAVALGGGFRYEVETGRRDGLISLASNVDLPGPSIPVSDSIDVFAKKGLNLTDMVLLLGGHSVGITHCSLIEDRLYNFKNTGNRDPNMNIFLAFNLRFRCPQNSNTDNTVDLDQTYGSSLVVDKAFYQQIQSNRGILEIDQAIALDPSTKATVASLANGLINFPTQFGAAMVKLGAVGVLTGKEGEVRKTCGIVNHH